MYLNKQLLSNIATIIVVVAVLFFIGSCKKVQHEYTDSVTNIEETPTLRAIDVTTTISDSGITRYRIITPLWEIYDAAKEPYWLFAKGIKFERFDEQLNVDANIHCDKATYLSDKKLWHLEGNVKCVNLDGERFETQELFWDQSQEQIYSDSLITIYRQRLKIVGEGFVSNQTMSQYHVLKPSGIIPINTEEDEQDNDTTSPQNADLKTQTPIAVANQPQQ